MKSLDSPSVTATGARLRHLAGELRAAADSGDHARPCPPALRADAALAEAAAVDLATVADACGVDLAAFAYAAAALDRDRALLEAEAATLGLLVDGTDVRPAPGLRPVSDPDRELTARSGQAAIRRRLLLWTESRARLDADLRAALTRHTDILAAIADRLR